MNAFIIQSRKHLGFADDMDDVVPEPQDVGLTHLDPYPWEAELTGMNDDVSPYVQFLPQDDSYDHKERLEDLRERLVNGIRNNTPPSDSNQLPPISTDLH